MVSAHIVGTLAVGSVVFAKQDEGDVLLQAKKTIDINADADYDGHQSSLLQQNEAVDSPDDKMVTFSESIFCKSPAGGFIEDNGEDACTKRGLEDIVSLDECEQATKSEVLPIGPTSAFPAGCIKFKFGKGFAFNRPCTCPGQDEFCIGTEDIPEGCNDQCSIEQCARYISAPGGTNCPENTQIRDEDECQTAAAFLFPNPDDWLWRGVTQWHMQYTPGGCFHSGSKERSAEGRFYRVRMNQGDTDKDIDPYYHAICKARRQGVERLLCGCPSQVDYCIGKEDVAPECKDQCPMKACESITQAPGGTSCPPSTRIDDYLECWRAAKGLGKWGSSTLSKKPEDPTPAGCFLNKQGEVKLNPYGEQQSESIDKNVGGLCKWKVRP